MGHLSKTVLVGALVFLTAYAAVLWFKYTYPPDTTGIVVQNMEGDMLRHPTGPDSVAPVVDPHQVSATRPDISDFGISKPGHPDIEASRQQITKPVRDVTNQAVQHDAVVDEPIDPQLLDLQGDLSISGRVLTSAGTPVPGIRVRARASYLFEEGQRKSIPRGARDRSTTSAYDGTYAFEDLVNGEYLVSTVATPSYAQTLIQVRAGVDFADLVVTGQRNLRVHGLVTDSEGEPLPRVLLRPAVQNAKQISTNEEGRYGLEIKLLESALKLTIRASRVGYKEQDVRVNISELTEDSMYELNIVMEPESDKVMAQVAGLVRGPLGAPVSGQRIGFSSAKGRQNYRATTDAEGRFVINNVVPGEDYMLSINATPGYKDFFQRNIKVTRQGATLQIKLEPQDTGTLSGRMVNLFGNPVPDFSLVLQTKESSYFSRRVIGDGSGNFEVANAPAGELRLWSKSTIYYTVDGIQLPPGGTLSIPVVLDWGYDEIHGRIVNEDGYPVAVTNIYLTWSNRANGLHSTSRRTTAADEQGIFRFTQLGPGSHRLSVNAAGYKPVSVNHDVALQGSELVVKLEAK